MDGAEQDDRQYGPGVVVRGGDHAYRAAGGMAGDAGASYGVYADAVWFLFGESDVGVGGG